MILQNNMNINKIPEKKSGIFKDFCREVKQKNPYVKPNYVKVDLENNPVFNLQVLRNQLMNLDKLSDQDLYSLIYRNCDNILSNIFVNGDKDILQVFTHPRFLTILNQVLYKLVITYDIKIYCNKIIYDYLSLNTGDQYVRDLLLILGKTVNRNEIASLVGLGLDEDYSTLLAIARFSSKKDLANIKRLNFTLCNGPRTVITEQMIVNIYEKLIDNFTILFKGTMFDVYDTSNFPEEHQEIYADISLAVLDIMNNMPSNNIKTVLSSYAGDYYSFVNTTHTVRFSMQCLSYDYFRITQVVEYLKNIDQIYIP